MNLQQFLDGKFQDAQQRLKRMADQAGLAVKMLTANCDHGKVPYRLEHNRPVDRSSGYSQSTHAMVLHALAVASGRLPQSVIVRGHPAFMNALGDCAKTVKQMSALLRKELSNDGGARRVLTSSQTYGNNDPLTISWLVDLQKNKVIEVAGLEIIAGDVALRDKECCFDHEGEDNEMRVNKHAFPVLRQCLIEKALDRADVEKSDRLTYFLERLHRHLSLAAIPDSRFDPAEMVFSLEGALTLDAGAVDSNTLNRVIEVLRASQEKSAYWRPVAPMLFTYRGAALHPLSIEVVNSLLRICATKDEKKRHNRLFEHIEPMLSRYYDWMSAQMVTITVPGVGDFSGWHSENISDKDRVDVWETSQVLIFLLSYSALLREQIAADALNASGLKVEVPERDPEILKRACKEQKCAAKDVSRDGYWDVIRREYEPFDAEGFRVYHQIGDRYVMPRSGGGGSASYSMVLYGPPGTGKSTIPTELARCLGQPLITVTISDFLSDGAPQTEQRAKALFQVLEAQGDVVVLMDEIDHFILDRESNIYREQESVFQFMTPGMLTKLRDLRDKKNCIFILATNFKERLDSAAIRLGRIDDRFLVMPPDRKARLRILRNLVRDDLGEDQARRLDGKESDELRGALEKSALYIYNEIRKAWSLTKGIDVNARLRDFAGKLDAVRPATNIRGYRSRFKVDKNDKLQAAREPFDEFLMLAYFKFVDALNDDQKEDEEVIKARVVDCLDLLTPVFKRQAVEEPHLIDETAVAGLKRLSEIVVRQNAPT